jgi:hypothetical protein
MTGSVHPTLWQPGLSMHDCKVLILRDALLHHKGNKRHAARALGLSERIVRIWVGTEPLLYEFWGQCHDKRPATALEGEP